MALLCSDGNDGKWSSFILRVGNPAQNFRVLISTQNPESWVILQDGGCNKNSPQNCASVRGAVDNNALFDPDRSTSWESAGNWSLAAETKLGYDEMNAGAYGYDTLGVGTSTGGIALDHQVVAGIITEEFYVGALGLAERTPPFNRTQPSFISSLRSEKKIPSLSFGYTAGAYYNDTLGSLTLGGYDASRAAPESVPIIFSPSESRYLNVGIQSITFTNSTTDAEPILSEDEGIFALLDSTIPDLWLPEDVCDKIADAFGLTFNSLNLKYTITDEQHEKNVEENPTVSFKVGNLNKGGPAVDIAFPYSAFAHNFTDPKTAKTIRYVPIRQASSEDQHTLGRVFLQEAYLTVDYERENFSLAQALAATGDAATRIVPIVSPADEASTSITSPSSGTPFGVTVVPSSSSSSFPMGAIAGIIIPILLIAAAAFYFWYKRKKTPRNQHFDSEKQHGAPHGDLRPGVLELPENSQPPSYDESQPGPKATTAVTSSELEGQTPASEMDQYPLSPSERDDLQLKASPVELPSEHAHDPHPRSDSSSPLPGGDGHDRPIGMDARITGFNSEAPQPVGPFSGGSHLEPGSPESIQSAERRAIKSATDKPRMISVSKSPASPSVRRDCSRTSQTSDDTLGETWATFAPSGRTSPEVGGRNSPAETFGSLSAFQSPTLPFRETSPDPGAYNDLK